jgi:hypothetical protein
MAAATAARADLSSSTAIERYLRSREKLANQVAVLRLGGTAAAAKAWRELGAVESIARPASARASSCRRACSSASSV